MYQKNQYANWSTSFSACKTCEVKAEKEHELHGLKSRFKECFKKQHNWGDYEFNKPNTFEIWSFRKGNKLFEEGVYFMDELTEAIIDYKEEASKLSSTERQWLQIEKEVNNDTSIYVDENETLKIQFNNGRTYEYYGVPESEFNNLYKCKL